MKNQKGFTSLELIFTLVIAVGIIGWFANIYQVAVGFMNLELLSEISGLLVFKTVAIFLGPVGSVMGIVGFF